MAKKPKVNKTQAVKEYLKANPTAKNQAVADALAKKGITLSANYVATIKTQIKKTGNAKKAAKQQVAVEIALPAAVETAAKAAATVTLEHVKAVALTVKTLGGPARLSELLGLIKEVGGVKKFKDLLEAISGTEADASPF
jgi:hypothetical protein